jgi:hypothetical protein
MFNCTYKIEYMRHHRKSVNPRCLTFMGAHSQHHSTFCNTLQHFPLRFQLMQTAQGLFTPASVSCSLQQSNGSERNLVVSHPLALLVGGATSVSQPVRGRGLAEMDDKVIEVSGVHCFTAATVLLSPIGWKTQESYSRWMSCVKTFFWSCMPWKNTEERDRVQCLIQPYLMWWWI